LHFRKITLFYEPRNQHNVELNQGWFLRNRELKGTKPMQLKPCLTARGARVLFVICFLPLLAFAASQDHRARVLWVSADQSVFEVSPLDGTPALELARLPHVQALAVDPQTDHLWVYSRRHLQAYDAQGNVLVDVALRQGFEEDHAVSLAVDGKAGNVWLATGHRLYRFDLAGTLIDTIRLHRTPVAMSVDPSRSHLWLAEDYSLAVLDQTGATVTTVDLHALHQHPETVSYDATLDQVWVGFRHGLARYDQTGAQVFSTRLDHDLDDFLAPDGEGNVWLADGSTLAHVDQSGAVDFKLRPFAELNHHEDHDGHHLVDLVADPLNHTVWVASHRYLQQYATDSTLLQTVDSQTWLPQTGPGDGDDRGDHRGNDRDRTWTDWGWFGRDHQGVHHVALYVDTVPPTVSVTSPADGTYTNHTRPDITLSYSDIGSGVDVTQTTLSTADGVNIPVSCTATPNNDGATCTPNSALADAHYTLSVTVSDYAGNVSKPTTVSITVDTVPPTIAITSPAGQYTNQPNFTLSGHISEAGTLAINGYNVALDASDVFTDVVKLTEGANTFIFTATDLAGNATTVSNTLTLDTIPPSVPNTALISVSDTVSGNVTVTGEAGAMDPGVTVTIKNLRSGQIVTATAAANGTFSASIAAQSNDQLAISATDEAGNVTNAPAPIDVSNLPPDPATVAPPLAKTGITPFIDSTSFLYSGNHPIQTGVTPGTIVPAQAAVIRGRVLDTHGDALPGATITILDHPEFGQTLSRSDGMFDMAVNGGDDLVVQYKKKGYLPVQRQISVSWQNYVRMDDVVLLESDPNVTTVAFGSGSSLQVARGSVETDQDGTRQATLLFLPGTQATMTLPDGSTKILSTAHIRATEYTVGPLGPEAMPGPLPPTSGYTYAVDFSADEATDAGARRVTFSQPVIFYVNDFLNFPVGTTVPEGWYDPQKSAWLPSKSGLVIKILSLDSSGIPQLDLDGNGQPASAAQLTAVGITHAELTELASLYPVGESLWRVAIPHFSGWDSNWGREPPKNATQPPAGSSSPKNPKCTPCCQQKKGCIIEAATQTLRQKIEIIGTPFSLYYGSDRVSNLGARSITITLSTDKVPDSLQGIELKVDVAGKEFEKSFPPNPNQNYVYTWDGSDAYGRSVTGIQTATVSIGYTYNAVYSDTELFGYLGNNTPITVSPSRQNVTLWNTYSTSVGNYIPTQFGGSSWTLNILHAYDSTGRVLYKGDGTDVTVPENEIVTVAGNGDGGVAGDGGLAVDAAVGQPTGVAVAPDGSLYVSEAYANVIRKIAPDGTISTIAGKFGTSCDSYVRGIASLDCGDGGLAINATLGWPMRITIAHDGSLIVPNGLSHTVRRIDTSGIITTIAGNGVGGCEQHFSAAGSAATSARLSTTADAATGADGSIYLINYLCNPNGFYDDDQILKVQPDGTINILASGLQDYWLGNIGSLAIGKNGELFTGYYKGQLDKLTPFGDLSILSSVNTIGNQNPDGTPVNQVDFGNSINDLAIGSNDSLYVATGYTQSSNRVFRIAPGGSTYVVAGKGPAGYEGDGGPALQASLNYPSAIAVGPDNSVYIADQYNNRVRRVSPTLPAFVAGGFTIASSDAKELYDFDSTGKQLDTRDAVTGQYIYQFTYDANGRLVTITDGNNQATTIMRDDGGNPVAITSPNGQKTVLSFDSRGDLVSVSDPAGNRIKMQYLSDGLMSQYQDANGNIDSYTYDANGLLTKNTNSVGSGWSISRSGGSDSYVVNLTSGEGRKSSLAVNLLSDGGQRLVSTNPDGTVQTEFDEISGEVIRTARDGTITDILDGPDPRFGMESPIAQVVTVSTPGGLKTTTTESRKAPGATVSRPFSFTTLTDIKTVNGDTFVSAYDPGTLTWTQTSPMGRKVTLTSDKLDRPVIVQLGSLGPVSYGYDSNGHVSQVIAGSGIDARTTQYRYYASGPSKGYLQSITDPLNRTVGYQYDAAGRVIQQTFSDGEMIKFSYDPNGNLTSLTPPSRPAHGFDYDGINELLDYTPPTVSNLTNTTTHYSYNLDRQLTKIARPDGRTLNLAYDTGGRLSTITVPTGMYQYSYNATTGQVASLTAPDAETLAYTWDGFLGIGTTWSGAVSGSVADTYDNNFRVTGLSVNGTPVNYAYDKDGELTGAGDETLTRDPADGLLTGTTLGSVTTGTTYNSFGEALTETASDNTASLYSVSYNRDNLGRITQKTEIENGVTTTWSYSYDTEGRLASVTDNGTTIASYGYDANGNRTTVNGQTVATYDEQDRLLTYGQNRYTYTANGDLLTKTTPTGTTQCTYDVMGNLTEVKLPDSTDIQYVIDGQNRRIGKKVNGTLTEGFLYQDQLNPVAELDGSGNVIERFVYGSRPNVPDYIVKDGNTYRVVTDQLGSPRLIVDTSTGAIAEQIDYDAWGNVTNDTNPGFQPFGFAGGLQDHDTKLIRFGTRDYDPSVGRWTSKDSIGFNSEQSDMYLYCNDDSVNCIDSHGMISFYDAYQVFKYLRRVKNDKCASQQTSDAYQAAGYMIGFGNSLKDTVGVPGFNQEATNSNLQAIANQVNEFNNAEAMLNKSSSQDSPCDCGGN
jgi:RHS repeat-associated protein